MKSSFDPISARPSPGGKMHAEVGYEYETWHQRTTGHIGPVGLLLNLERHTGGYESEVQQSRRHASTLGTAMFKLKNERSCRACRDAQSSHRSARNTCRYVLDLRPFKEPCFASLSRDQPLRSLFAFAGRFLSQSPQLPKVLK